MMYVINKGAMQASNRRKRPGVNAFSFLSSQDSSNNSANEDDEEEEESKTSTKDDNDIDVNINPPSQNVHPILPTLERAIQLHYLAQNVRRGFHGDSYGRQHAFADDSAVNDHGRRRTASFISTFLQLVKKTIYCTLMMIFIVLSSALCYAILYNCIMPSNAFTREVFFDYCAPSSSSSPSSNGRNIVYPRAEIDLMCTHKQWTAYVNDIVDPFVAKESFQDEIPRILEPRQSYYIHLALTLPESSINRDIGMFMVNMKLYHSPNFSSRYRGYHHLHDDEDKQISEQQDVLLATSFRPAMLPFQSTYVSTVKKSTIMIPLVIGAVPEARTIVVESFDHFLESFQYPFTKIEIELVSTNQQKDDSHERPIQIHKAELRIGMELTWFQRMLKEWFYTCATVGCFMFAFVQVMGWSLVKLLYRIKIKAKRLRRSQLEDVLFDDDEEDISYLDLSETDLVQDEEIDKDDDSEQWDPIPQTGDETQSAEDVQQHAVVEDDNAAQSVQDHHTPSQPQQTVDQNKNNKRRNRKKKKKSSTDHTNDGMQEVVHRVMQGDIGPYEIFTDLDEPS